MAEKPTYEELEQRVRELEKTVSMHEQADEPLRKTTALLDSVRRAQSLYIEQADPQGVFDSRNTVLDNAYCQMYTDMEPGEYVLISLSDTGEGMASEVLEHLFDPFFTTKEVGKGTGLGLPMVYGVMKQNNGYVQVDSEIGQALSAQG